MNICPCCGSPVARPVVVDLNTNMASANGKAVHTTPSEAVILNALINAYPGTVRVAQIIRDLWGMREEPETAGMTLRVWMTKLRHRLVPLGLGIKCTRVAHGGAADESRYRLVLKTSSRHLRQRMAAE